MKALFFLTVILIASSIAHASLNDLDLLKAVVNSPTTAAIVQTNSQKGELIGAERTQLYRCQGCFEYQLKFRNYGSDGEPVDSLLKLGVTERPDGQVVITKRP